MIRVPPICPTDLLAGLLDDSLPLDSRSSVTEHLDECTVCRDRLQTLAADESLWRQTRTVLSSVTDWDANPQNETRPSPADSHLRRLLPRLQPSQSPGSLGRLGDHEIESVIGLGGMGVVLKARDESLSRTVAIKMLHPHLAAGGAARRRFSREARAAAAVNHPSVVPIHAVDAEHQPPYLVMAFVPGGTLQDRIDHDGPLSVEETLRIALQITEGLAAAHGQGVVHRDVKPGNILLDHGQDRVLLSDFGLAQVLDDASLTCSGMIAGTPQYMSPEQARGETVDPRSDLFSLGGVIYTMLTGHPPFRAATPLAVLRKIETEPPRAIAAIQPQIPTWVQRLVESLQQKRAVDRPASAEQVVGLLRQCLAHVTSPQSCGVPTSLQCPSPRTTERAKALTIIVACLSLAGSIWWAWANVDSPPRDTGSKVAPSVDASVPATGADAAESAEPQPGVTPAPALLDLPPDETAWNDGLDPVLSDLKTAIDQLNVYTPATLEKEEQDVQ